MKLREISLRYLRGQKKHTIITIIAIITATAFMTVMLAAVSVYRAASLNICRETNGTYHVVFNGLDKDQLVSVRSMDIFDETQVYSVSSYTSSTDVDYGQMKSEDARMEYLILNKMAVDDVFLRFKAGELTMLPSNMNSVFEGRLPEKDGEIVLSAKSSYMWGYPEIGDTVTAELVTCKAKTDGAQSFENVPAYLSEAFDIEEVSEISFTVVGFSEESNIVDYSDTRLKSYSYLTDNVVARFSDKANDLYWDMNNAFHNAGYEVDEFSYGINQELLNLEGKGVTAKFSQAVFFALVYLVVIFLMFCVRMVIDNSFELSSKERIKQFGLLKAVGASGKQVFAMVVWEAVYLAVPGVTVGILLGTGCAAGLFGIVKDLPYLSDSSTAFNMRDMLVFELRPYVFISSALIGILWVVVSAVSTGMRSIKSSPVEAMNSAGKSENIRIPKHPSGIEKGRGFIGAYSSLSIKRSRKRYIITMVSMVMSIVLFATFSYGAELANEKITAEFEENRVPNDFSIQTYSFTPSGIREDTEKMISSGYFENVQYDCVLKFYMPNETLNINRDTEAYENGGLPFAIHPISRETFDKYITADSSITYDELEQSGAVLIDPVMKDKRGKELYRIVNGDALPESLTAAPFIDSMVFFLDPVDIKTAGTFSTELRTYFSCDEMCTAIMADSAYEQLVSQLGIDSSSAEVEYSGGKYTLFARTIYADAVTGMETEARNFLNRNYYNSFTDNAADMSKAISNLGIVKTVGYFAVLIIALIAAVNIVNIISANVLGRTSELAMLRACGMSDRQLHKLILSESLIYAALASFSSLLVVEAAVLVIQIPFKNHFHDLDMEDLGITLSAAAPLKYILIAAAVSFVIAAAASFVPARRIIKTPIVENIRNTEN
ncbi:MAG: ABC transporter permease [Huintestinicola sp.]|uniref:ABC transporter permease n=1 Tax=Huintestinicola sp. TaxID=2981661 RepID=UPI003EFCF685